MIVDSKNPFEVGFDNIVDYHINSAFSLLFIFYINYLILSDKFIIINLTSNKELLNSQEARFDVFVRP